MADDNSETVSTPVVVNSNPVPDQARSGIRSAILLASGLGLVHFLTPEQLHFLESDPGINAIIGIAAIGAFLWAQLETRWKKRVVVAAAGAAPNDAFIVESKNIVQSIVSALIKAAK